MENKELKNKELESKELEGEELKNANGGYGNPGYVPVPGPGYNPYNPYLPPYNPNMPPVNPNVPPYDPAPRPKIIGYKTYCFACGRKDAIYLGPNATIIGSYICTCGAEMVDDGEIYE